MRPTTAVLAIVLLTACQHQPPPQVSQAPTAPSATVAPESVIAQTPENHVARQILHSADRVETYRTHGQLTGDDAIRALDPRYRDQYIRGSWKIDKVGPVLGPDFARRLEAVLLDSTNFIQPNTQINLPPCGLDPDVAFRLRSGNDSIEVVIDFKCPGVGVFATNGNLSLPSEVIGDGYPKLTALAKEAFPNDLAINALR